MRLYLQEFDDEAFGEAVFSLIRLKNEKQRRIVPERSHPDDHYGASVRTDPLLDRNADLQILIEFE